MLRWCWGGDLTIVRGGGAARWVATVGLGNVAGVTAVARACTTCAVLGSRQGFHAKVGLANCVGGAVVVGLACRDVAPGGFARQGTGGRGCGWREMGATSDAWRNGGAGAAVTWSVTPMRNDKEKRKNLPKSKPKLLVVSQGLACRDDMVSGGGGVQSSHGGVVVVNMRGAKYGDGVMCGKAVAVTWHCDMGIVGISRATKSTRSERRGENGDAQDKRKAYNRAEQGSQDTKLVLLTKSALSGIGVRAQSWNLPEGHMRVAPSFVIVLALRKVPLAASRHSGVSARLGGSSGPRSVASAVGIRNKDGADWRKGGKGDERSMNREPIARNP
ncbi:hypothetical protein EDB89DRAFT_1914243 [Lactarius sanguifluus]|nr:hypothetical protein EDB89DRAFT_1914243 [Lactarius sanguifluus]